MAVPLLPAAGAALLPMMPAAGGLIEKLISLLMMGSAGGTFANTLAQGTADHMPGFMDPNEAANQPFGIPLDQQQAAAPAPQAAPAPAAPQSFGPKTSMKAQTKQPDAQTTPIQGVTAPGPAPQAMQTPMPDPTLMAMTQAIVNTMAPYYLGGQVMEGDRDVYAGP